MESGEEDESNTLDDVSINKDIEDPSSDKADSTIPWQEATIALLLIEKEEEWTSKYEQLQMDFEEATDCLKRERNAHLIAVADAEKREEGLKEALGIEKLRVLELEEALRKLGSENAEIKLTAESKLTCANALLTSAEEEYLEADVKQRDVDGRLAQVERKSEEVEARESFLQKERGSYTAEREAHEANLLKQMEDFRDRDRELQEREEQVAQSQILIKMREDMANERENNINQKGKEVEDAQQKIDATKLVQQRKEDMVNLKVKELASHEKEIGVLTQSMEAEKETLLALRLQLRAKEQDFISNENQLMQAKKELLGGVIRPDSPLKRWVEKVWPCLRKTLAPKGDVTGGELGVVMGTFVTMTSFIASYSHYNMKTPAFLGFATLCGLLIGKIFDNVATYVSTEEEATFKGALCKAGTSLLWLILGGLPPVIFGGFFHKWSVRLIVTGLTSLAMNIIITIIWTLHYEIPKLQAIWLTLIVLTGIVSATGVSSFFGWISEIAN